MKEAKLAPWNAAIQGKYLHVYYVDFPLNAALDAPEGWEFFQVRKWRPGCQDECWRVRYRRKVQEEVSP